jgi:hypothetical protein
VDYFPTENRGLVPNGLEFIPFTWHGERKPWQARLTATILLDVGTEPDAFDGPFTDAPPPGTCEGCGQPLTPARAPGRQKRFCDGTCWARARRRRQTA